MRRGNKQIFNGFLLGASITTVIDIMLQWNEHKKRGEVFTWKKLDGWRTIKWSLTGGAIGGAIGFTIHRSRLQKESKQPFTSDKYLNSILAEENLKSDKTLFRKILIEREKIKKILTRRFGNKLAALPEDTGSFYKRTAIGSNYDLDVIIPFKKYSFRSLELMYNNVYDVLLEEYGTNATIKKQRKAIGLVIELKDQSIQIDVVPGREIKNYSIDGELNLYVNPDWFWQPGTSFKTNIQTQKTSTVRKPEARNTIKLLKSYRDRNDLELPSLLIEQCVVDALSEDNFGTNSSPTENMLNSMEYISERIEGPSLIDKANSNNNLLDKVTSSEKMEISNQLNKDLESIEDNPRNIKELFE